MARRLGVAREDVVAAAVRVCDRDGLEGLTVSAVAAEVGCRPPSVYHHVSGLDGLVRAVVLVAASQLASALEAAGRDAGPSGLAALVEVAHDWGIQHPARFDALRRPVRADEDPEVAAARASVLAPVQEALAASGVSAADRPAVLAAVVAAVRGSIATSLDAPDDDPDAAQARDEGHRLLRRLLLAQVEAMGSGVTAEDARAVTPDAERSPATT